MAVCVSVTCNVDDIMLLRPAAFWTQRLSTVDLGQLTGVWISLDRGEGCRPTILHNHHSFYVPFLLLVA